jgi:hypothetical protein
MLEKLAYGLAVMAATILIAYERVHHEVWWHCVGKRRS